MASSPREDNRVPGLVAKSDADNTAVPIEADPITKRLKVSAIITSGGSGGGGTQYTDGDATITHPIGTIPVYDKAGTITAVSVANPLPVSASVTPAPNVISTVNSSSTTLAANAAFTGTSEDVSAYADIRIAVFSDVASATDGLSIQQSTNGTNWDQVDTYTVPAGTGKAFDVPVYARYFRIVYTNGATIQAAFRLQSVYHLSRTKPSSQRPQDSRLNDNDMEENLSYGNVYDSSTNTWSRASAGNGTTGLGTQRVTLSSDSTGQVKLATGANVIGSISNSSFTATQGTAAALTGGWPTINGELGDFSGTFTNATQTTSVTATNLDGYGNTLISINGTYGTATAIFEGSDDSGTTWYTVQAARDNTNVIETGYTGLTNISQTWQINNPGFDSLRVRSTAVTSGTVNVRLSSSAAPVASGTIIGIGTAIPAGTNVIGHVIADSGSTTAVTQATGTNLHTVLDSGTLTTLTTLTGTTTLTPGVAAANLGKAEDATHTSGDTGVFTLGVRNDGAATSFTNANGDYNPVATDAQGRMYVVQKAPTATLANVNSSATNVTILAANTARIAAQFYNDSTSILYLKFGTTASTTSFTVPLAAATYYELPGGYTGNIDGIWASANGAVRVTELS